MAEQNPIRYQDLITPDDSIEKLVSQLQELQEAYASMANTIKQEAQQIAESLAKVSGANEQGKKKIAESNTEATKLQQAYKKLEEAMSANGKQIQRLNRTRSEYVKYQKMMQQRGKEEIRTMQQIKEASYQQLSAQYSLNKAYINSLTAKDRNIQKNKELIRSTKEIYEQMKKLQADTGKMQLNVGNYPDIASMASAISQATIGIGSVAAAGLAAINALKGGIETSKDYEKSISGLAAILETTTDKITELTSQARHLGATTVFTAKEVAELQTELAKLGYSVQDIINMTPYVLSFAQATGSSLADAASLTGAALRMFGKETTDTQEIVDKMTASTTKSALSFSYINNALSTVAPVANAFGFKIEEVLALLGQLANAGFDASSAATATRNIILNLADANGKLAKALGEPVTNLDELIAGLNKLKDEGIDLGEALDLTDKRSVAAFNTFLQGTETVISLRDELNNANGAAQKMAKTMGDNLAGDTASLTSAWEDLMIEINNGQSILRNAVQWLTNVIRNVGDLYRNVRGWFEDMNQSFGVFNWYIEQVGNTIDRVFNSVGVTKAINLMRMLGMGKKSDAAQAEPDEVLNADIFIPTSDPKYQQNKGKDNKVKTLSAKEQKAAQAAAKRALQEQQKQQKQSLDLRRAYDDAMLELIEDEYSREYAKTSQQYERKIEDLRLQLANEKTLSVDDRKIINDTIVSLEQQKYVKLADLTEKFAKKDKEQKEKKQKEDLQAQQKSLRDRERAIELQYDIDMEEIDNIDTSEKEKTRMRLEAEKKRLQALLALYEADGKKLSDKEVELIKKQIANVNKELDENSKSGDIYDILGLNLNDKKKKALDQSFSIAMSYLTSFIDSYAQAAEKKRQLADAAVESAQNVLEKEIEARNNGYANEVDTARKELENAKKNQQKAIEQQKKAQMAQEAIQTAQQASSLITATAEIWSAFASSGPWGIAAAIAATALMFGSFAASKIKAMSVAGMSTEEYGEGTVELLEGGSHQSGNDIDLGRKPNGTRRRAEGGEFFAVINKRNSRKYRGIIPDVMHSLNNGTFAEKYMNAYDGGGNIFVNEQNGNDLTRLQDDVRLIREQGEQQRYVDGNGNTIIRYKNLRRTIRR